MSKFIPSYKNRHFNESKYNEMPIEDRNYLVIPYEKKDAMKTQWGLKWDSNRKLWYISKDKYGFGEIVKYEIINLEVPYETKDYVKSVGCKWNGTNWYTSREIFEKYEAIFNTKNIFGEVENENSYSCCSNWMEESM